MGVRTKQLACLGILIGLSLLLSSAAQAERVVDYQTAVAISVEGQAHFSEAIQYSFDGEHHGIYRDIPVATQLPDKTYLLYTLSVDRVLRNGTSEPFVQTSNGVYERLKIGDVNGIVSGTQGYTIDYRLGSVVRHDTDGDYISLVVIGTAWEVPIDISSATVSLPSGITPKETKCYTGAQGSREQACTISQDANVLTVHTNKSLNAHEGLTLDVLLPANSFAQAAYNTPSKDGPKTESGPWLLVALFGLVVNLWLLIPLSIGALFFTRWWLKRKGRKAQTVIPYYDPPDNLLPAEVGYLTDDISTSVEITATIIHLATRGHLKIHYEEQKRLIGTKQRFRLEKLKGKDSLQDFEATLMSALFTASPLVYIDELDRQSMAATVSAIQALLKERLRGHGFYNKKSKLWAPDATEAGYKEWAKVEGLKLYLSVAEKDRMKFHEAPEKTPARFSKLLPYAIALGVEQAWAAQFKDIDVTLEVGGWYDSHTPMNALLISSVMRSSFTSAVSSNMTPPSSSSGFSSGGGGFSGGGSGGGGGGSW